MVKRDIYTASIAAITDTSVPATTATEINSPSVTPTAVAVNQRYGDGTDPGLGGLGGYCNSGGTCYAPRPNGTANINNWFNDAYTAAGTPFCVIDPNILP
jgi:hypothetical protein